MNDLQFENEEQFCTANALETDATIRAYSPILHPCLNLKIATNLNKLDVYATSDFKSLQKMQWIGLLKQEERERERQKVSK